MNIKNGFILCAGRGTRMGPIGQILPKPLFPLFDKALIDYHILSMKKMGIENIFVNVHHLADQIISHLDTHWKNEVHVLHEVDLLDVGGAVSNLKFHKKCSGPLLLVLSDMIFPYQKLPVEKMVSGLEQSRFSLLMMDVGKKEDYGKLLLSKNHCLEKIVRSEEIEFTYAGVSLINMDRVLPLDKPQKFFGELVELNGSDAFCLYDEKVDFYDFGKTEDFIKSHFKIIKSNHDQWPMLDLKRWGFVLENKLCMNGYGVDDGLQLGKISIHKESENGYRIKLNDINQLIML